MKFIPKKYRDAEMLGKQAAAFDERLAAAEKIEQPADRLEALLGLQSDMSRHVFQMGRDFGRRAANAEMAGFLGGFFGLIGGGIVLTIAATPFVGVPVIIAGIGLLIGSEMADVTGKMVHRMMEDIPEHVEAIKVTSNRMGEGIDDLLKNRSADIAASEKFDGLYDRYPHIRDSFIKTFNKAVAKKELAAQPSAPKGPAPKLAL